MTDRVERPDSFFGFRLGDDYKMARWDRITEYFYLLNQQSENIRVVNMGPTTENNPFLLAIITSAENLAELDELRETNRRISDPRGLSDAEINHLVDRGKVIVCQSMGLHANEIASTQMAPQLAYDLVAGDDETTKNILDNVIFLMVPCFNPDGQIMVADWYNEHLGTEYEGCDLPWLYHKYCGHDNNRDAFMLNLVESRYMARIMFNDWHPHVFQDHHEMGGYQPRLFVCPYCEPIHPHADPLIWREINWYGAHMVYKLEEAGKQGVISGAMFPAWYHMGFHWLGNYHNIASLLTETAQAKLASPLYVHPHQLTGEDGNTLHTLPHYKPQTNFPNPWPGGWWRLRDMVDQQRVAAIGLMDIAARCRETVLRNAAQKALHQTGRGRDDDSAGFFIRSDQHDAPVAAGLVNALLRQGIDVQRTRTRATVGTRFYPAGTWFISNAQPKRGVVKTLLERTLWPDDAWARKADGSPTRIFDTTTDTLAEMMGVVAEPSEVPHAALDTDTLNFDPVTESVPVHGAVTGDGEHGMAVDPRHNAAFSAVNELLETGAEIGRTNGPLTAGDCRLPAGAFVVREADRERAEQVIRDTGASGFRLEEQVEGEPLSKPRIAMYQRYWGGNMPEGWTRMTLEQAGFHYRSVRDADIRDADIRGGLRAFCDALILPDDTMDLMAGTEREIENRLKTMSQPEAYRSALGDPETQAIGDFVEKGGTLVAVGRACRFPIEKFGLHITDVSAGLPESAFFCPGSMLRIRVDVAHRLGYGMPNQALAMHRTSPVHSINPSHFNDRYEVVAAYPEKDVLESGWLIGEEHIAGKPAMISVRHGEGRIVLYGFQVNFRNQTQGTFKLLFNALYGA